MAGPLVRHYPDRTCTGKNHQALLGAHRLYLPPSFFFVFFQMLKDKPVGLRPVVLQAKVDLRCAIADNIVNDKSFSTTYNNAATGGYLA